MLLNRAFLSRMAIPYVVAVWLVVSLAACQSDPLDVVRSVTYEPEFHYISQQKWATTMRQFEVNLGILNRSLGESESMTDEQRLAALSILTRLDKLSLNLAQETLDTHQDFGLFRSGIKAAREELQQDPPQYGQIMAISAYCTDCHAKINQ